MTYALGIDLGTTYTAAAVAREGRAEIAALGYRATSVPTVVCLTEDGRFLVGDAAERRAGKEPHRVAREFKRRVGDPTPLLLGGSPVAIDRCLAEMLHWVATTVGESEGRPPAAITVTHPANWGEFKQDVLREAFRLADLPQSQLLAEPVAAATWYARSERLAPGHVVAVYDLGGGTFDTAVLRHTTDGRFETLGRAEGIERLGGIDVDQAVLGHALRSLGGEQAYLDDDSEDPATITALAQLRRACVEAKEALSSETSVGIPVWLPGVQHEVLMQRAELEELVAPLLRPTIEALGRVVRSSGLRTSEIHSVLLVGGSSRIPMIAREVSTGFGRPVAVDAHPKHPVALGAALHAWANVASAVTAPPAPPAPPSPAPFVTVSPPNAPHPFHAAQAQPPQPLQQAGSPLLAPPPSMPSATSWPGAGPPHPPIAPPYAGNRARSNGPRAALITGITAVVLVLAVVAFLLSRPDQPSGQGSQPDDTRPEQAEGSGTTLEGTASTTGDDPEVDPPSNLYTENPQAAFDAFAAINGGAPVKVSEITLYEEDARAIVQTQDQTDDPTYFDDYQWAGGDIATNEGATTIPPSEDEIDQVVFAVTDVDPAIIPGLVQDAVTKCDGDGFQTSLIVIHRFVPFDDRVTINVYRDNPDRTSTGGYVKYGLDGAFIENLCD